MVAWGRISCGGFVVVVVVVAGIAVVGVTVATGYIA